MYVYILQIFTLKLRGLGLEGNNTNFIAFSTYVVLHTTNPYEIAYVHCFVERPILMLIYSY